MSAVKAPDERTERKFGGDGESRLNPRECRHLDCDADVACRVISPFGTGNFCREHGMEIEWLFNVKPCPPINWQDETERAGHLDATEWVRDCFRYGPTTDPDPWEDDR